MQQLATVSNLAHPCSTGFLVSPTQSQKVLFLERLHQVPQALATTDMQTFHDEDFEIVHEKQVFKRYLTLYDRRIKFPAQKGQQRQEHDYDIIGHPQCGFHFVVTFPFHASSNDGQVTLLREHAQGPNQMMWVLPTGGFDPLKHGDSWEAGARAEMSEEAHLNGGDFVQLTPAGHPGIVEGKWCANRFTPFLCLNPQADLSPGSRDEQECIEVHRISIAELREIMHSGDMLLPSITTCFLALARLQQEDLIP
ncbi:hypothetical protein WJX74_007454 [Apatococcus lobatus]|uniref:Nudix hydrolase domain-containing protein n=1 Tax=Apatococcus lobatus TaxID=904363 RepID=A0AAW1QC62_9CHLO